MGWSAHDGRRAADRSMRTPAAGCKGKVRKTQPTLSSQVACYPLDHPGLQSQASVARRLDHRHDPRRHGLGQPIPRRDDRREPVIVESGRVGTGNVYPAVSRLASLGRFSTCGIGQLTLNQRVEGSSPSGGISAAPETAQPRAPEAAARRAKCAIPCNDRPRRGHAPIGPAPPAPEGSRPRPIVA